MLNKKLGTIYEAQFKTEALKKGLDVFPAEGDYSVVDCIVLNPAGKTFRVQVKGTSAERTSEGKNRTVSKNKFKIVTRTGAEGKELLATEVDVLACYIEPRDTWYIMPMVKAVGRKSFAFFLCENSTSQWEPYRNNWDIFYK